LVQTTENSALLKYTIRTVGAGVTADSINWPIVIRVQQLAVSRYLELHLPPALRPLFRLKSKIQQQAEYALAMDLRQVARLEKMEQFELFLRSLARQRIEILYGKLKKMKDLASLSPEDLKKKMSDKDLETQWMAIQVVGAKRYPLVSELIERLAHDNRDIRQAARKALIRISRANDFGPGPKATKAEKAQAIRKWQSWWSLQDSNPKVGSL